MQNSRKQNLLCVWIWSKAYGLEELIARRRYSALTLVERYMWYSRYLITYI